MKTADAKIRRPCCLLLKKLADELEGLEDPKAAADALATISKHCVLMQWAGALGAREVKIDLAKQSCQLVISPETSQAAIDEMGKTVAVHPELADLQDILIKLNGMIANNAELQQISAKNQVFLQTLREGERKFGAVPDTLQVLDSERPSQALSNADSLLAHPIVSKSTQFDGVPPKVNPDIPNNPDAAEKAQELQNQHRLENRPQPAFTPRPTMPGQN